MISEGTIEHFSVLNAMSGIWTRKFASFTQIGLISSGITWYPYEMQNLFAGDIQLRKTICMGNSKGKERPKDGHEKKLGKSNCAYVIT